MKRRAFDGRISLFLSPVAVRIFKLFIRRQATVSGDVHGRFGHHKHGAYPTFTSTPMLNPKFILKKIFNGHATLLDKELCRHALAGTAFFSCSTNASLLNSASKVFNMPNICRVCTEAPQKLR